MNLPLNLAAPARLGGWLALVGLTLMLSLLLTLAEILPLYQQLWSDWAGATDGGLLTPVVAFEALGNALLLLANLFLLLLFLRRSRFFPRLFIGFCLVKPLFFLCYITWAALLLPPNLRVEVENYRTLGHGLLYAAICVCYMRQSARVQATFRR